ncbi:sigma-70 family RNA polymerase sigma factor [Desemzia sp. C1]|uniref:sigma-70 family RNA polymerase sigma factor n=1 Tax=Desemzia sp. C1 TaxID=2892016 RepID=UPI001E2B89E6|nr:sigma-70 family RNA polymerase sigma factor [Desemzia sp. C1]MCI3027703.1 sigma-70 family RNA polymerase sigma factor [Desemzia sp. C1]
MWHYADELADEYKEGLEALHVQRNKLKAQLKKCKDTSSNQKQNDVRLLGGMISDMEYAISWLESAREPGSKRGISNRSRYQRTQLWAEIDMLSMQAYRMQSEPEGRELTAEENERMDEILSILSEREREAYKCIYAEGHTYAETAYYMGISRGATQSLINRAKAKIQDKLDAGQIQMALKI